MQTAAGSLGNTPITGLPSDVQAVVATPAAISIEPPFWSAPDQSSTQLSVSGGLLRPGALLARRYRIVRLVGRGGFGAVYEANDEHFQARRTVALKELDVSQLSATEKSRAIEDFRHEANFLVLLKHPNFPAVSDFFEAGGHAYLVMEFIEGKTLKQEQKLINGPVDEQRVMNWALQLCHVLHYLHTQPRPIIFRDLKPANVMITHGDQIKLIDFGIARFFKTLSSQDTIPLGTYGYAPMEQCGQGQSDARSDIYALGATLYDLLTQQVPPGVLLRHHCPSSFLMPRQLNPHISPATERIVLKAMAEQPGNRFQSAQEMYQAIAASGIVPVPHEARPTMLSTGNNLTQLPPKRISRRTLLIGAGASVATGATLYLGSALLSNSRMSAPRIILPTINVIFAHSSEKAQWIADAADAFNRSPAAVSQGKRIQVNPQMMGFQELTRQMFSGGLKPVAWSPPHSLEIDKLTRLWQQKQPGQDIIVKNDIQSLVQSLFVFAVWDDCARVLLNYYGHIDWDSIYHALILNNGWVDIGGPAYWQRVSLGQTRPDASTNGLLSLMLIAYYYFRKTYGLTVSDIDDPGFLNYLSVFENAVTAFGHHNGTYLKNEVILKGPGAYNIVLTYENEALAIQDEAIKRQSQRLRLFYPQLNILSDHPFVLLNAPWVTAEEQMAARSFRDFLLAVPQQQLVMKYGLRPTNANVPLNEPEPGNLLLSSAVHSDIQINFASAQLPGGLVVNELNKQWLSRYKDAATANG